MRIEKVIYNLYSFRYSTCNSCPIEMNEYHVTIYGQTNRKPVFIFSDTGRLGISSLFLATILQTYGFKVIVYRYGTSFFDSDPAKTVQNIEKIKNDVLKRIATLGKREQKHVAVFGTGIGNMFTFAVANDSQHVKKIVANIPFSDLSVVLLQKGKGKKNLKDVLFDLNPINNIDRLNEKKILIYSAKKDERIPFIEQEKIIKKLDEEGIECQLVVNTKHNHLFSSFINLLKFDTYLRFLEEKDR